MSIEQSTPEESKSTTSSKVENGTASTQDDNQTAQKNGMALTEEERKWAIELKDAMQSKKNVGHLTDFEIAQFALIASGDASAALKRIVAYQKWKTKLGIPEKVTLEDVENEIRTFNELQPGFVAAVQENSKGNDAWCLDTRNIVIARFKTKEQGNSLYRCNFYYFGAMTKDFDSIRKGCVFVCENEGRGWANFSLEMEKKSADLYQYVYPIDVVGVYLLNPTSVFKMMLSMTKPVLTQRIRKAMKIWTTTEYENEFGDADPVRRAARESGEDIFKTMLKNVLERYNLRMKHMQEFKL